MAEHSGKDANPSLLRIVQRLSTNPATSRIHDSEWQIFGWGLSGVDFTYNFPDGQAGTAFIGTENSRTDPYITLITRFRSVMIPRDANTYATFLAVLRGENIHPWSVQSGYSWHWTTR